MEEAGSNQPETKPEAETGLLGNVFPPHHEEYQYLELIENILSKGEHRKDRTGTGNYCEIPLNGSCRNDFYLCTTSTAIFPVETLSLADDKKGLLQRCCGGTFMVH